MSQRTVSGEYAARNQPFEEERVRLEELARGLDPGTRRALLGCGLGAGWKCLEVGAAVGTMSRWLAEQVGSTGQVVACDIDVRFLGDLSTQAGRLAAGAGARRRPRLRRGPRPPRGRGLFRARRT